MSRHLLISSCVLAVCTTITPAESVCFESEKRCVDCFSVRHCDDGLFCNGSEGCEFDTLTCTGGTTPCLGSVCDGNP